MCLTTACISTKQNTYQQLKTGHPRDLLNWPQLRSKAGTATYFVFFFFFYLKEVMNHFPVLGVSLQFRVDFLFAVNLRDVVALGLHLAKNNGNGENRYLLISLNSHCGVGFRTWEYFLQYFPRLCFSIYASWKRKWVFLVFKDGGMGEPAHHPGRRGQCSRGKAHTLTTPELSRFLEKKNQISCSWPHGGDVSFCWESTKVVRG